MTQELFGELDRYLFSEGRHRRLWQVLGAHPTSGGARFAVWAPNARRVSVVGDWNGWNDEVDPLFPQGSTGVWGAEVLGAAAGHCYKYVITGADGVSRLKADPMAGRAELPPSNASIVAAPSTHQWTDAAWMATRDAPPASPRPLRVYEVHLGSWQRGRSYREAADLLAVHVRHLGFTHVEFLPLAEHPFSGSWGYQVTGYYAPTSRFGSPDDLRYLVDRLHAEGVGVIIDWVPAHFPRDDWALARFDGTALYEHADPRQGEHPDWGTLVFNYGRHEVKNFLVANALWWFHEFHVDGLRVDAVASMLYLDYSRRDGQWLPNRYGGRENLEALDFLREVNATVLDEFPGALLIAEESTAWPGVSHRVEHGGLGFTHKWNMGWMHDTLSYLAHDPVHRKWHHRDLTFGFMYAWSERFVLPLSHDEVVHGKGSLAQKMAGDPWQKLANLRALYGWMWAYPGAPLLFMGSEIAPWTEWDSEVSLPWELLEHERHRGIFDLVVELNRLCAEWPAVWERDVEPTGFQWLDADDAEASVFAFLRWGGFGQSSVACMANLTPVPREGYRVGLPWGGEWRVVLDTDAHRFGGSGFRGADTTVTADGDVPWQGQPASAVVTLPPLGVVWLGGRRA
jgi:1,4-alpha-glucan branching enzyme